MSWQQPAVESYPEAVETGYYPYNQIPQHTQAPQYPAPGLEVVPPPPIEGNTSEKVPDGTVLGVKKSRFWLLALLAAVIVIAAVGGGVGGSLASRNKTPAAPAVVTSTVTNNGDGQTSSDLLSPTATDATATSTSSSTPIAAMATGSFESQNQVVKTGLTASQYQTESDKWTGLNYELKGISGYSFGTEDRYAAAWGPKSGTAFYANIGLTSDQYQSELDSQKARGYYPILVDAWTVNGTGHFAAIWQDSGGNSAPAWSTRFNLNTTGVQAFSNQFKGQGYCITELSGYAAGTAGRYSGLWSECPPGTAANSTLLKYDMTPSQYQATMDSLTAQTYRVSYIDGYTVDGRVYYSAIFTLGSATDWYMVYGWNSTSFQAKVEDMNGQGYSLSFISGYTLNDKDLYAAVWDR